MITPTADQTSKLIGKTILITEDDLFIRELYSKIAAKEGFTVITAGDGEELFKQAATIKPDLFMIDLMLPKIDGLTALKRLKNDPKFVNTPCVIVTVLEDPIKELEAKSAGAVAYLLKVRYTPRSIINEVKKYIH
jgi:CheY-like chemotaxis protein